LSGAAPVGARSEHPCGKRRRRERKVLARKSIGPYV
jgi:hypothetical protein